MKHSKKARITTGCDVQLKLDLEAADGLGAWLQRPGGASIYGRNLMTPKGGRPV